MKKWMKNIKPLVKNYRWWIVLPIVVVFGCVLIVMNFIELIFRFAYDLSKLINMSKKPTPEWVKSVFKWVDDNE